MNELLRQLLTLPEAQLWQNLRANKQLGELHANPKYLFFKRCQDDATRVLAVVHTDVSGGDVGLRATYKNNVVTARALDDRLGLYMLLQLIEKGHTFDLLVTTDEELGQSTATDFLRDHPDYRCNWMFSIDRRARYAPDFEPSAVLYEYHDDTTVKMCEELGIVVEYGSFSDISSMSELGVKGFNFSATFFHEHTDQCYADLRNVATMIDKISQFLTAHQATRLLHTSPAPSYTTGAKLYPLREFAVLHLYDPRLDIDDNDTDIRVMNMPFMPTVERKLSDSEVNLVVCASCSGETLFTQATPLAPYLSVCNQCLAHAMQSGSFDAEIGAQESKITGNVLVANASLNVLEAESDHCFTYYGRTDSAELRNKPDASDQFTYRVWKFDVNHIPAWYTTVTVASSVLRKTYEVSSLYSNMALSPTLHSYEFAETVHIELMSAYRSLLISSAYKSAPTFVLSLADATSITPPLLYMQDIFDKTAANDFFAYAENERVMPVVFFGSVSDFEMVLLRQKKSEFVVDVLKHNRVHMLTLKNALEVYMHFKRSFLLASKYLREGLCFSTT